MHVPVTKKMSSRAMIHNTSVSETTCNDSAHKNSPLLVMKSHARSALRRSRRCDGDGGDGGGGGLLLCSHTPCDAPMRELVDSLCGKSPPMHSIHINTHNKIRAFAAPRQSRFCCAPRRRNFAAADDALRRTRRRRRRRRRRAGERRRRHPRDQLVCRRNAP